MQEDRGPCLDAFGVECVPHAWGSAIGLAATLHFLASMPDQPPSLFADAADAGVRAGRKIRSATIWRRSRSSRSRASSQVPTGAGLGIEIDRSVIDRYRVA